MEHIRSTEAKQIQNAVGILRQAVDDMRRAIADISNRVHVETQRTISDWAVDTFGYPKSLEVIRGRLLKEVKELELIDIWDDSKAINKIADECADIYIVLVQVMATIGYDLHICVDRKMQINRNREWKLHGDGTAQHIE